MPVVASDDGPTVPAALQIEILRMLLEKDFQTVYRPFRAGDVRHSLADISLARERLAWLDGLIAGREFITGDALRLADILLFAFLEFGASVGQGLDAKLGNLQGWYTRVAARPSIAASKK